MVGPGPWLPSSRDASSTVSQHNMAPTALERVETVEEDPTVSPGHGAKRLVDAFHMALITVMCLVDDMTPESPYSKVGFNTTADAQTMRKAPKKYRTSSTALLRLLAWGGMRIQDQRARPCCDARPGGHDHEPHLVRALAVCRQD